ncbi:MAG: hypothetical protein MZV70_05545 [Desulfobacterales bacterium]|nr:hypothetical protein [Desulfobacterales bacterium]
MLPVHVPSFSQANPEELSHRRGREASGASRGAMGAAPCDGGAHCAATPRRAASRASRTIEPRPPRRPLPGPGGPRGGRVVSGPSHTSPGNTAGPGCAGTGVCNRG